MPTGAAASTALHLQIAIALGYSTFVFLPLLLIMFATVAAALVAYGTHHVWAQYPHGIEFILLMRRLEWPIAAVALILCLAVIALVIAGKRRAWWMLGIAPVLGLFLHHLSRDPYGSLAILDNPTFIAAADAKSIADGDYVVGLTFANQHYAYPYNHLFVAPVIFQQDQTQRMVLIWSAYANRAAAWRISHELRASDVEIVSWPANALVIYNTRLGQFINGVSATTSKGETPTGFIAPIAVQKMTWGQWRKLYPNGRVLAFTDPQLTAQLKKTIPSAALEPSLPMPRIAPDHAADARVAVLATTRPVALPSTRIGREILNFKVDQTAVLLFRHPRTNQLVAFDRRIGDMVPRFELRMDRRLPEGAYLVDSDNLVGWTADGRPLVSDRDEETKHLKPLQPILLEDGLYWGVMKFWLPALEWYNP